MVSVLPEAGSESFKCSINVTSLDETDVIEPQDEKTYDDLKPVSFASVCMDGWSQAVTRVQNGRVLLEDIGKALHGLQVLEHEYAVGLKSIAKKLKVSSLESPTVEATVTAFQNDLFKRAHHSEEFAASLSVDVLASTIDNTVNNHAAVFRQVRTDGNTLEERLEDAQKAHEKAMMNADITAKRAVKYALKAQQAGHIVAQQRTRLHKVALQASLEAFEAEQSYQSAVSHLNSLRDQHKHRMKVLLDALEDMDSKRMDCLRDSLIKAYVHRASQSRNMEYDTTQCIEVIKQLSPAADLQAFLARCKSQQDAEDVPTTVETIAVLDWPDLEVEVQSVLSAQKTKSAQASARSHDGTGSTFRNFFKQTPLETVVQTAQAQLREFGANFREDVVGYPPGTEPPSPERRDDGHVMSLKELQEETQKLCLFDSAIYIVELELECSEVLSAIWKGDFVTLRERCGEKQLAFVTEDLNNSINRQVLCHALIAQTQKGSNQLAGLNSLKALALVCKIALDWSDAHNDFWTARVIMFLSQQLWAHVPADSEDVNAPWAFPSDEEAAKAMEMKIPEGTKTIIRKLHQGALLYEHPLWNRVPFWEEAFLLTVSEDRQRAMLMKAWSALPELDVEELDRIFRQRNPCWSWLSLFAQCMTSFGISELQVTGMINKLCKTHGLGAEYADQLLNCLHSHAGSSTPPADDS